MLASAYEDHPDWGLQTRSHNFQASGAKPIVSYEDGNDCRFFLSYKV